MDEPVLSLRDFRVTFNTMNGKVQAVRGIDLDVGRGEMVGIVGESGSGKSVTFLGLMGLLPKSAKVEGSAKVNGEELVGLTSKQLMKVRGKKIAMIFQDPLSALNPVQKIGVQIVEMIRSHEDIPKAAAHARAVELLDIVGIPQPAQRALQYPHEFSGGMRQRVMIAMALLCEPDILIADEPTTALDVTIEAQIVRLIKDLHVEFHGSIVFVSHSLGLISELCDEVAVMYAGKIVESGPNGTLFGTPRHPYTLALLACEIDPDDAPGERLVTIEGGLPDLTDVPPGCIFAARCPLRFDKCVEQPPLRTVAPGHRAACWLV